MPNLPYISLREMFYGVFNLIPSCNRNFPFLDAENTTRPNSRKETVDGKSDRDPALLTRDERGEIYYQKNMFRTMWNFVVGAFVGGEISMRPCEGKEVAERRPQVHAEFTTRTRQMPYGRHTPCR